MLQASLILITAATLVDGTGAPARKADVLIRDGKIAEVGASIAAPAGARVIRAEGQTLLPGLFDLHTHLPYSGVRGEPADWGKNLKQYLIRGVTSVVDFGVHPEQFAPMRRLVRDGVIAAPRLHLAARFTTPGGHGGEAGRGDFFSSEVLTPREAKAAMQWVRQYKPDAIKVFTDGWRYGADVDMTSMDLETLRAIVEEAHRDGLEVLTHTVTLEKAKIAARAGVNVIAHGIGDAVADPELFSLMKAKSVSYAPTLAVYRLRENAAESRVKRWGMLMANVKALRGAGIAFGTGTDAGVTGTPHGESTLRELELLVEGGLTPLEAIQAATLASARALHVDAERGSVEPGKLADLVLIAGEPHVTIADINKTARVFLGGVELDRDVLARQIAAPGLTPIPACKASAKIDDFERPNGRTAFDTLPVNQTDAGHDHTKMLFGRIARTRAAHAMSITARLAQKERPFARLVLPLSPGSVEPVDVSAFRGVRFEARGAGEYRLIGSRRSAEDRSLAARFSASAAWRIVRVPFSAFDAKGWDRKDLLELEFEVSGKAGDYGWLELDNVYFYR